MTSPNVDRQIFHCSSFSSFVPRQRLDRFVALQREFQEFAMHLPNFADPSRVEHLLGLHVDPAIALLKAKRDVDLAVGPVGGSSSRACTPRHRGRRAFPYRYACRTSPPPRSAGDADTPASRSSQRRRRSPAHPESCCKPWHPARRSWLWLSRSARRPRRKWRRLSLADPLRMGSGIGPPAAGADDANLDGAILRAAAHGLEGNEGRGLDNCRRVNSAYINSLLVQPPVITFRMLRSRTSCVIRSCSAE